MDISLFIDQLSAYIIGWPLIIFAISVGIVCTIVLSFIQIRYFLTMWREVFAPQEREQRGGDMTPLQAFVNTLSTNLGNGSLAGMATAVYSGGPGAAIWVLIIGFLLMSVRFAEVYLSAYFGSLAPKGNILGGPMLYLRKVIGGPYLAYIYALLCLPFGLVVGNAAQTNSIRLSLQSTWNVHPYISAFVLFVLILYIVYGGAHRIVKISDALVPVKVIVFFGSSFIVLAYHYQALIPALQLMLRAAFSPLALAGGVLGFSVQQAMRFGIVRSVMATESGLGTAAILYGGTESDSPARDGIVSMLSTFISTLVCFLVALCIVASGVWNSGLTSTALTVASYQTVFGRFGGWAVSFLSVTFGLGVLVSYAYITRAAFNSVMQGKMGWLFPWVYSLFGLAGAVLAVDLLWKIADLINVSMLVINLFGILYLLPVIMRGVRSYRQS